MSKYVGVFTIILLLPLVVFGAVFGSKSLLHVQTASTLDPGRLDFRSNVRFYTKVGDFLGSSKPANFQAVNYWDVQGNALLTVGIVKHFDATVMVRGYQDTHQSNENNTPDDIFVDLKAGNLTLKDTRFNFGGIFSMRFPSGDKHNYPFEAYTAGATEFGFMGIFSYYNDPFLPDRDFSLHVNAGWYYHNDAGKVLFQTPTKTFKAGNNASEFQYGLAFSYPTELFNLNLEWWGIAFINKPDSMAFSRENFSYITPSIVFKPRNWIDFNLGVDIRVSTDTDQSARLVRFKQKSGTGGLDLPNYSSWKVTVGTSVTLSRGTQTLSSGYTGKGAVQRRTDFFENLLKEKEKSRKIEDELRRLRKKREQAEKELEELRQLLEEQGK